LLFVHMGVFSPHAFVMMFLLCTNVGALVFLNATVHCHQCSSPWLGHTGFNRAGYLCSAEASRAMKAMKGKGMKAMKAPPKAMPAPTKRRSTGGQEPLFCKAYGIGSICQPWYYCVSLSWVGFQISFFDMHPVQRYSRRSFCRNPMTSPKRWTSAQWQNASML